VDAADNVLDVFIPLATGIEATPPINVYEEALSPARNRFYRVRVQ